MAGVKAHWEAMTDDPLQTIRVRLAANNAKLAKLRAQVEALALETAEYETALKVFQQVASAQAAPASGASSARPEADGPTMPDLIIRALEDGPRPISDITGLVQSMSEKPIDPNNIRSTAWRLWKAGRISKTGDDYHLNEHVPEQNDEFFCDLA